MDTVFDCLDRAFGAANVFVLRQSVEGNSRDYVVEACEFAVSEAGCDPEAVCMVKTIN